MTHGMTARLQSLWTDLDDLVVEEYCALDHRPSVPEQAAPPAGEVAIPVVEPTQSAASPQPDLVECPDVAQQDCDESRFQALCRILGTAEQPYRLVERLADSLPAVSNSSAVVLAQPSALSIIEPPDVE